MIEAFPIRHASEPNKYDVRLCHPTRDVQLGFIADTEDEALLKFEHEVAALPLIKLALDRGLNSKFTNQYMLNLGIPQEVAQRVVPSTRE